MCALIEHRFRHHRDQVAAKGEAVGTSSGHHFDPWLKPELMQQRLAVFPSEAKCAHVRDAEARNDGRKRLGLVLGKLAVHEGALRPVHQLRQRDLMVEVGGDLVGDGLLRACQPSLPGTSKR
ncbi:MAG: hypothetical protein HY300_11445 [Verrucomicrobia bacterium]|nr:hypothetical protein [Verrucomicrobiota bacterium]